MGVELARLDLREDGCSSIWLTAGTMSTCARSDSRYSGRKLLTPIPRTLLSASSFSSALYAAIVRANSLGSGWCRISKRMERLVVAVVADPHLRLDEDVAAIDSGAANRLADLALVAICGGGVDVPVADGERRLNSSDCFPGRRLEDAEAEGWQLEAVVQSERGDGGGRHASPSQGLIWNFRTSRSFIAR